MISSIRPYIILSIRPMGSKAYPLFANPFHERPVRFVFCRAVVNPGARARVVSAVNIEAGRAPSPPLANQAVTRSQGGLERNGRKAIGAGRSGVKGALCFAFRTACPGARLECSTAFPRRVPRQRVNLR
jgi:hypothetical protein